MNDVSGAGAMADRWPRVFNALSDRAFLASQQPDGLQVPREWLELIHGMPNLSDDFYYHLFSQQERCLEYILCSIARVVMTLITVWPTSLFHTRGYSDLGRKVRAQM